MILEETPEHSKAGPNDLDAIPSTLHSLGDQAIGAVATVKHGKTERTREIATGAIKTPRSNKTEPEKAFAEQKMVN